MVYYFALTIFVSFQIVRRIWNLEYDLLQLEVCKHEFHSRFREATKVAMNWYYTPSRGRIYQPF